MMISRFGPSWTARRRSRKLAAAAGAAAAALLLSACGAGASSTSLNASAQPKTKAKTVDITYWSSDTQSEMNYLDAHFNASHPGMVVKGEYIASADDTTAKVVAALKTGTEPNVLLGQDPADLPFFAESGKLVYLNGKMTSLTNGLYPGIRKALFYKGHQLGMALAGVGDVALFYNKKDFAAAGIAKPPATLTELAADAIKLTDPSKHLYGIYVPLGTSEWISYDWEMWLWANGGHFMNANDTKTAFDSPAGVDALTAWYDLIRKDHAAPTTSYAEAGSYDGSNAFAGNDVAMVVDGAWAVAPSQSAHLDFGVAPFPRGAKGEATNIGIGVAAEFDHGPAADDVATAFIKWLAEPAQGAYLAAESGGLPSSPAQDGQPALRKEEKSFFGYSVFAGELKYGHVRPSIPSYSSISQDLYDEINACLTGHVSPAAALAKASAEGNRAVLAGGGNS